MAQQVWRLPLENAEFPLLSTLSGSGVAVQGQDVQLQRPQDIPKYRPKLLYCQNVLPIKDGLKSVELMQKLAATGLNVFDEVWQVFDLAGATGLFSPASRTNLFSANGTAAWISNALAGTSTVASRAIVGGQSYICYSLDDIYSINCTTGVLTSLGATGIVPATDVKGITGSGNYLIAWNDYTIFWSSPLNPADFVPSLITGAGGATPTELKGKIIACYAALNGFYVYTTTGILLAQYSGNAQYPWIYKSIAGASAIRDSESVTHAAADLQSFAITSSGVVKFTPQGTEPIFPEVGDFLAARKTESWDVATGVLTTTSNVTLVSRVFRVGQRYLVFSYGASATALTHALVYDIALQRWGKVAFEHVYCFAYPDGAVADVGHSIAFMTRAGRVVTLSMDSGASGIASSVIIIGNIALTRSSVLTVQEVEINNNTGGAIAMYLRPSMDGVTLGARVPLVLDASGLYHCRNTAKVHAVEIRGKLTLTNLQVTTVQAGAR